MSGGKSKAIRSQGERRRRRKEANKGRRRTEATKARVGAAALLLAGAGLASVSVRAQDATWKVSPAHALFSYAGNWVQNVVPTGTATFSASSQTGISITEPSTSIGSFHFVAGAPAYTFYHFDDSTLTFTGAGVVNDSSNVVTFNVLDVPGIKIVFENSSSSAGSGSGGTRFDLTNDSRLVYSGNSTAGTRTVVNLNGANTVLDISGLSNSGITIGGLVNNSSGQVVLGSRTLTVNDSAGSVIFSGAISGTGGLIKDGTSNYVLTGTNTYTGATTITAGTLQVGDGGSTGTLGTGAVTNNGTLAFNRLDSLVISTAISGAGAVRQIGAGTTILAGANTYSGSTTIEAGTLQVGNGDSTGTLGTGAVTNNGTLAFNRSGGGVIVAADIGGTGAVRQIGDNTTILSGNNTYSGGTTIAGGALQISADGNLGAASGGLTFSGANGTLQTTASMTTARDITLDASGRLDVAPGTVLTANGNITGSGDLFKLNTGTLVLAGNNNFDGEFRILQGAVSVGGSANLGSSAIRFFNGSTLQTTGTFALANSMVMETAGGTLQVEAGTTLTASGVIIGSSGLGKSGAGTLVLTRTNSYAGDTRLNAGTLAASADSNLGNGGGLVFGGGTLRYDASFASSRAISLNTFGSFDTNGNDAALTGTISGPGRLTKTGAGTLTLSGTNTYASGTRIDGGTVAVSSNANLGVSNGSLFLDGGTLRTTDNFNTSREIILLAGGGTFDVATGLGLTGSITEGDGPARLTKTGAGLLILAGTTDYSGGTTVLGGTLQGTTTTLRGDITNNATVSFAQAADGTYAGAMSGSGGLRVETAGNVTLTLSGANTYTGGTVLAAGNLKGTTQSLQGNITTNNFSTVVFDQSTNGTYAGAISGAGGLIKNGAGTVILDGANSYGGGTTVSGGILQGNTQSLQRNIINNATVVFDQAANGIYAGSMTGSGSLIKSGAGTLVLTSAFNNYSGGTTVSAGTLQGSSTSLRGDIQNNAAVVFDQGTNGTYAGAMSGSGSLAKSGDGTLTLGGANSHTGGTTVNAGTLQLGSGGSLASSGALTVNGGTFDLNGRNQTVGALSGGGGAITLGGGTLTAGDATNTTLAAAISGTGSLVKQGAGTLTLSADNSYTGGTTISGGILQVGNGTTTGSITGNVLNNGTLAFNRSDAVTFGGTISGSGALDKLGAGTLILTGDNSYSGLTTIASGTLQLGNGGTTGSIAGNVLNNGTLAFNRLDDIVFGGNVDGSGAISYMGPGKVTLTGTISNTGGTVLAGGTVQAGSDAALGAAGATLTFAGGTLQATASFTVGRPVSLITGGGTIDTAGNSLMVSGNVTGAGGLAKTGDGTLILTGANGYTGGTTVSGGTLQGTTTSLQGNILNNAAVAFNQSTDGTYAGAMSGSGAVSIGGGGAVTFTGANSYTGATTIASGSKLSIGNGGTLGTGAVSNSGELHFSQGDTLAVSASIGGSGEVFLEEDSGTTIFTGSNSYTGPTRIWSGSTLQVGAGGTSGTLGAGPADINNGTLRFDRSDTLVVTGEISGTNGNVVQAGSGTTALTFDSIYRGTTTIEAGTLKLGNGGTTGTLGTGSIVNNGTLAFDRLNNLFVDNAISGTGGITQAGTGATYLTGNNTYTGTTTISAGTLNVGNAGTTGTLGTGNVVNDGTLRLFRSNNIEIANQISGTGNLVKAGSGIATLTGSNSYSGTTSILSGILRIGNGGTLGSGEVINEARLEFSRSNALTVANAISGDGLVTQTGAGTTSLTGSNSYGNTSITAGTLSVGDGGTTGTLGTGEVVNDATLQFNRSNALTIANAISGTGNVVQAGTGTTYLTRNNTYTGTTTISAGALSIGNGGTTGSIGTGNVLNNGTLQINRSDDVTFANAVSGTGSFVQAGPGTTILTGNNSYSGGTTVSGGTLQGTTSSLQGNIANNASVVLSQAANGTYAGNMSGAGSLTLTGGGQYTLTGTNSYTGGTSLLAGALIGNSASLQGNILNNGAVTFSQSGSGTYAGNMSGSGSMTLQGGGTLAMTGSSTYTGPTTVNASTLIVNGSLASTVSVSNGGVLAGSGNIGAFVSTGGILAPGNSIGTMTINGNFTQNGGTYVVEVNAQGQSDRVNVNGTATINGASVQVVAAPGNYSTSTKYTILNATGGVSGTYTGVATDYAFMTPSLSYDANNVFLTLALQGSAFSGFGGNTANQRGVGYALDQSYTGASGDFATVIGALANLSTTQAGPTLNTISGQPYADFGTFNVANNVLFMNAVGQQMALARGSGGQRQALAQACDIAACDGTSPFSVWASGVGGLGAVQGDGNSSTFTYNVGGTAAGIDYRVLPNLLVGLGAGYTSGTQWVDSFMGKGWSNSVSVAAYASFTQGDLYVDALAGYAYSNNQLQRQILVPGLQQRTANGSTGANQFLGQVETGYRLGLHAPTQATVTPFARFQASSINQAAFFEWGANSLSLNVAQQTTTSLRTTLGAELSAALPLGTERKVDLALRLGWIHEYANTARPMTAAFAGAPSNSFTVYGASPQRDSAVLGFQTSADIAAATQLYLRYDGEVGSGSDSHALNVGLRLRW